MKYYQYIVILFFIILFAFLVYNQIIECYTQNDPMIKDLRSCIEELLNNDEEFTGYLQPLNDKNILNQISIHKGNKSYTINKTKIYLCLFDENGQYYNKNMLMYVLLHEISHCICDEIGHTEKFYHIFDALLTYATNKNIYNPSIPIISNYCPGPE